ncbi:MAG: helix-turn-helix domain-containing protein [Candidatus Mcinerneyibacterium aminivorans]|uniref:Helix-turn-helix domain-containing protein n=1 Tax=Candidatus Mcinerneyibacterium aminivorans TaxID=2703815 RepID=A0A5D0MHR6_9BACT|nr:MAG: helix-turn-helix domain-containing protein [Candidatus Mcinerneyibacterium aminivorans]
MLYGEKIRQLRNKNKMTQQELAHKIGVTRQTISAMENDDFNPSLKLCIKIAKAFDTSLDEVFWKGNVIDKLKNIKKLFITDIGSTTTKGLYLKNINGNLTFIGEANTPTTVELPDEDVKIGVINTAREIEKKSNEKLLTGKNKLKIPYITTSSAGGGLQIMVFGLTKTDTGKAVELTAYGAGGVLLGKFTISDDLSEIEKMKLIRDLHPDLILMAGGINGGNIAGVVRLAELLKLSEPTTKFKRNERPDLIFCGNEGARKYVKETLKDTFNLHMVENIRPEPEKMNFEPAKSKVHELFMENVMERAPGYSELKKWVKTNILPTPKGVENILNLYSYENNLNTILVDMGGATTDIFSNILGDYDRTVSANIGMSYSISEILHQTGIENIMSYFPDNTDENFIRNYISNKMLNPTYIPENNSEIEIENAVASEGINLAWKKHIDLNYDIHHIGFLEQKVKKINTSPFDTVLSRKEEDPKNKFFQQKDFDVIIGAGGVLAENKDKKDLIKILIEGFKPRGITKLAVDKTFKSPHMGILAELDPEKAVEIYKNQIIDELAYVVAPTGKFKDNNKLLTVINNDTEEKKDIIYGDILYYPEGANLTIIPEKNVFVSKNIKKEDLKTNLAVVIDGRGRGEYLKRKKLNLYENSHFQINNIEYKTNVYKSNPKIEEGEFIFERKLPYKGEIFVKKGEKVKPDTIIGENKFTPPRIFIIDLKRVVGYNNFDKLDSRDIRKGIMVNEGDNVKMHQKIFKADLGLFGSKVTYTSHVRGKVLQIEDNGLIVLREIQDYSKKPQKVEIAKRLRVKPSHIKGYLNVREGDFVYKGQGLATSPKKEVFIKSPSTGTIKEINTDEGYLIVHYDLEPNRLMAFTRGEIIEVKENISAKIKTRGITIRGRIGFGNENYGQVITVKDTENIEGRFKNKVLLSFKPINYEFLKKAEKIRAAGIIAPSINNKDWVDFYNEEIGVALTGEENIDFTLILTEGFGKLNMNDEYEKYLEEIDGKYVSLSGRTQIRAGVKRPMIVVS